NRRHLAKAAQGGIGAPQSYLFLCYEGRTPIGHNGVADVLVDNSIRGCDLSSNQREIGIQELDHPLRRDAFAQGSKSSKIAKHDGDLTAVAALSEQTARSDELLGDARIHILAECIANPLPQAQALRHPVE